MEFTRTDRALMIRIGGHVRAAAAALHLEHAVNWGRDEYSKQAKRDHDRLLRDERDLEALRKRLEAQVPPEGPKEPIV